MRLGSLFVASYVWQGYGGGILTRLHTRHVHMCVYPHPFGAHGRILISVTVTFACIFMYGALSDERTGLYVVVLAVGSKSHRTRDQILLFLLRLGSFSAASYDSQEYDGGILTRLHLR
jgi:hypothetical protein